MLWSGSTPENGAEERFERRYNQNSATKASMGWLIVLVVLCLVSWLGWRWTQVEQRRLANTGRRLVKWLRPPSKRRKHFH